MEKKTRIRINDLDVDLDQLQKKDPEILKKIRGVSSSMNPVGGSYVCYYPKATVACPTGAGCPGGRPATTAICAGGGKGF